MKCSICDKETNSTYATEIGQMCSQCLFLITGRSKNSEADYDLHIKIKNVNPPRILILWVKDMKVTYAWMKYIYGRYSSATVIFNSLLEGKSPIEAIEFIYNNPDLIDCTECGKELNYGEGNHRPFVAYCCSDCNKTYIDPPTD